MDYRSIIPEQITGKDIHAQDQTTLLTDQQAKQLFLTARQRLLNVNEWDRLLGTGLAEFELTNSDGLPKEGIVAKGDYIKIDLIGPGPKGGKGYDWVKVEEVYAHSSPEQEWIAFRVRPARSPQSTGQGVAHFYSSDATSTFIVDRSGHVLRALIYDRNIRANESAPSVRDVIRDNAVAAAGKTVLSKIQWTLLVRALIRE